MSHRERNIYSNIEKNKQYILLTFTWKCEAPATITERPTLWKRYLYDTFTIMKQNNVDNVLNHLNQQHPSIRLTMESESDSEMALLDPRETRGAGVKLHTSVYRKPPHTDQYPAYDSHDPQSVKNGVLTNVYTIEIRTSSPNHKKTAQEKKHLTTVFAADFYPSAFL